MLNPSPQFSRTQRGQAEVVEEIVAKFEGIELATSHQDQQRLQRHLHLAEAPTQCERPFGVGVGHHDRT